MNYIPVSSGYVVVRCEITWPRGEGAPSSLITEHLGDVVAVDPGHDYAAVYFGAGRTGRTDGAWSITERPDAILAASDVILPRDTVGEESERVWQRLVRQLESRGIHQLGTETQEVA